LVSNLIAGMSMMLVGGLLTTSFLPILQKATQATLSAGRMSCASRDAGLRPLSLRPGRVSLVTTSATLSSQKQDTRDRCPSQMPLELSLCRYSGAVLSSLDGASVRLSSCMEEYTGVRRCCSGSRRIRV
jgi:hypothetical protein